MERELFDWDGWGGDHEQMKFYDVVLKKKIGEFDIGTKLATAVILFDKGIIRFGDYCGSFTEFRLHYLIGERL